MLALLARLGALMLDLGVSRVRSDRSAIYKTSSDEPHKVSLASANLKSLHVARD